MAYNLSKFDLMLTSAAPLSVVLKFFMKRIDENKGAADVNIKRVLGIICVVRKNR